MTDEDYAEDEAAYEGIADMEYDESYYEKTEDEDEDLEKEYSKFFDVEEEAEDVEYEFDSVVGARDKKPVMNVLNKTKLSKMEMDELFNEY